MRRRAAPLTPPSSSPSPPRGAGTPIVSASSRRCVRPVRPGCTADASSSVPITAPGFGSAAYGRPSTSAEPVVAGTRPVIIRIVVVLPAPLGPRNPVTVPGSRVKETSSTTVRPPYCLVNPLTWIIGDPPLLTGLSGLRENPAESGPATASVGGPHLGSPDGAPP